MPINTETCQIRANGSAILEHLTSGRGLLVLGAVLAALGWGTARPAYAGDNPTAVLILDSSKSMWGQIDGKNKVIIARRALETAFSESAGKINLGIVAYGHRKSIGCTDIEAVLSPRPIDPDSLKETINSIRPRGSTPIARSLEIAAAAAGGPRVSATIVLLSDGLDNCRKDPCATAKKLKAGSPLLKIDVIAFDKRTQNKLAALKCISENTGGKFFTATNATELSQALKASFANIKGPEAPEKKTIDGLSAWDKEIPATEVEAKEEFGTTEVLPTNMPNTTVISRTPTPGPRGAPTSAEGSYGFSAILSDNGKKIQNGLIWRVYHVATARRPKPVLVETSHSANPVFSLKPGRYLITVTYGKAYATRFHRAIANDLKNDVIVLNAGGLRLGSVLANGTPVNKDNVRFNIYSDERDQFSRRKLIMKDVRPGIIIRLNSGIYHLKSTYGAANATVEADVTVEAGKLTETAINHSAGKVTLKLVRTEGGEALSRTRWLIKTADGKTISESVGAFPTHILAAGKYLISARHDGQDYQGAFEVVAGDIKQVEVMARQNTVPTTPGVQSFEFDPSVFNPEITNP